MLLATLILVVCSVVLELFLISIIMHLIKGVARIAREMNQIVESQRLSTVLRIEPTSLNVSPEQFEPNREVLKAALLERLEKEDHPNPPTRAYCILSDSGLLAFVNADTGIKIKDALTRLLANGDEEGAKNFLIKIVENL